MARRGALRTIILGIVCTGLAYILYFRLITRAGASRAIAVTYLIPVFGMLWGSAFLLEPITSNLILGCGVILFGVAVATGVLRLEAGRALIPVAADAPRGSQASRPSW